MAGGFDDGTNVAITTAELYDPGAGTFGFTSSLTPGRESSTATTLQDGRVVVIGGDVYLGDLDSVEIYQP